MKHNPNPNLTVKEMLVLEHIWKEKSNAEIAEELIISVSTAETHRKNIMKKIGAKNVVSLIKYIFKNKLFTSAHLLNNHQNN